MACHLISRLITINEFTTCLWSAEGHLFIRIESIILIIRCYGFYSQFNGDFFFIFPFCTIRAEVIKKVSLIRELNQKLHERWEVTFTGYW